jgi:hypothetical protein
MVYSLVAALNMDTLIKHGAGGLYTPYDAAMDAQVRNKIQAHRWIDHLQPDVIPSVAVVKKVKRKKKIDPTKRPREGVDDATRHELNIRSMITKWSECVHIDENAPHRVRTLKQLRGLVCCDLGIDPSTLTREWKDQFRVYAAEIIGRKNYRQKEGTGSDDEH